MSERVSRKGFVAGAAGLAASLALPAAAGAEDAGALADRLDSVANDLNQAGARLDRIDAALANPPDPDKPAIREALVRVKTEAEEIVVTADDMLRRV